MRRATAPAMPTFGLPCPTTIYTLGLLLWAERPMPRWLLTVPLAWSVLGASAARQLGVWEDLGLVAAGVLAGLLVFMPQTSGPSPECPMDARGTGRAPRAAES